MKLYNIALLLVICCIVGGCNFHISRTSRNSWIGHHYSELVDKFGEPEQILEDGTGGKILSWSTIPIDEGLIDNVHRKKSGVLPYELHTQVFWINFNGVIYRQGI